VTRFLPAFMAGRRAQTITPSGLFEKVYRFFGNASPNLWRETSVNNLTGFQNLLGIKNTKKPNRRNTC